MYDRMTHRELVEAVGDGRIGPFPVRPLIVALACRLCVLTDEVDRRILSLREQVAELVADVEILKGDKKDE